MNNNSKDQCLQQQPLSYSSSTSRGVQNHVGMWNRKGVNVTYINCTWKRLQLPHSKVFTSSCMCATPWEVGKGERERGQSKTSRKGRIIEARQSLLCPPDWQGHFPPLQYCISAIERRNTHCRHVLIHPAMSHRLQHQHTYALEESHVSNFAWKKWKKRR